MPKQRLSIMIARTEIIEAGHAQMRSLAYASGYIGNSNPRAIELAERLADITYDNINHFYFTSGGGEATDSNIKMARYYWKLKGRPTKTKVISRIWGYHGVTLAAMCATGIKAYWPMFEPLIPRFVHIPSPYPYRYEAPEGAVSQGIAAGMERGMFSRVRGDVYCIAPPIVTGEDTIDQIVEILARATKAVLG